MYLIAAVRGWRSHFRGIGKLKPVEIETEGFLMSEGSLAEFDVKDTIFQDFRPESDLAGFCKPELIQVEFRGSGGYLEIVNFQLAGKIRLLL